jgi:hypothetical protein
MGILDYIKDAASKKTFAESQEQAVKIFTSQKEAIKAIADTTGYAEIKAYWERAKESSMERLATAKVDDPKARAMFTLADGFLKFLEARIKG